MIKLYVVLLAGFLNSCINGYDGSVMGGINAMEQYQSYFHMKRLGSGTGIVFMIYTIGNMVGSFITGPIADSWGRRWGMFSGSAIVIVGATVQGMSKNRGAFLAGRFILGFGASITTTSGPTYVAEMAHPAWRGPLTGLYNTFYFVGAIMAAWVMYGTQSIDSDVSWRLPILLQTLAAGLVLVSILFCPETPRWLVSNDHNEEAIRVLTRYFGEGNRKSPIVLLSYREMVQEIILYGSDKRWWDFSELWSTHGARRRLLCVAGMAFFGQWSGNGAVQNYMPVLMDRVGIASRNLQLLNNAILYVVNFFVSIAGALLVDKVGRRPMLLFGTAMFVVWWLIISVMTKFYAHAGSSDDDAHGEEVVLQDFNVHGAKATVAMIFLFSITHSFSYTSLQVLYPVECLKYETRAKGMGVYSLLVNFASLFNSFGMAVVIERIGWGFCVIYIVWDVIEFICIYLFFVETKNRTLEEINEIFVAPNPKEKSLEQHVLVVTDRDLLWDQSLISSEGNDLAERHPMPDGDDAAEMGDWGSQGKVPRIEVTQPGGE
ncbi:general substrate transporter [Peziza echinospora]|nr:general substrate transporter [Peziza echinospora]